MDSFKRAFSGYEEVQDFLGVNLNWANLGATYLRMGRVAEANKCLTRALAYFASVDNAYCEALRLMNWAKLKLDDGNRDGAREFYLRAREKYETCAAPDGARAANFALQEIDQVT
ncbi:hypothetical protein [Streptomyces sp. NPDC006195]|uniref:hypothetical protein n=1 Tax=unclassified Streptomyces TaxID=2593676 RepID=UPI0033A37DB9